MKDSQRKAMIQTSKVKQIIAEDIMIHKIAHEVAQEYLKSESVRS